MQRHCKETENSLCIGFLLIHNKLLQKQRPLFSTHSCVDRKSGWVQPGSSDNLGNVVADAGGGCPVRLCSLADHWWGSVALHLPVCHSPGSHPGCLPVAVKTSTSQPERTTPEAQSLFTALHPSHLLSSHCPMQGTRLNPESSVTKLGSLTAVIYLSVFKELKGCRGKTRERRVQGNTAQVKLDGGESQEAQGLQEHTESLVFTLKAGKPSGFRSSVLWVRSA